jgi:hypothetical protein
MAYKLVKENIEKKIGGEAVLREAKAKAVRHSLFYFYLKKKNTRTWNSNNL